MIGVGNTRKKILAKAAIYDLQAFSPRIGRA
jgi:hypothetical protein